MCYLIKYLTIYLMEYKIIKFCCKNLLSQQNDRISHKSLIFYVDKRKVN